MKIAIISDIHANAAALKAFPESYDELWVIGDLVNFGPHPAEVVDWVRKHTYSVVRGNHDHAVGYDADPRCIPAYQAMAAEIGPQAFYATWEDEELSLKRYSYPFEVIISAIESMPISQAVQHQLSKLITTGDLRAAGA